MLGVLVLPLLALYLWYRYAIRNYIKIDKMFPGPPNLPFVGNALVLLSMDREVLFRIIVELFKKYGTTSFRVWLGPRPYIVLSDVHDAEIAMTSTSAIDKSVDYDLVTSWLGTGLLTSKAKKWKKHRKILTPSFHFGILQTYIEIFQRNAEILVSKLGERQSEGVLDVYDFVKMCAMDNVCETAMGIKIGAQENPQSSYVQALSRVVDIAFWRGVRLWFRPDFLFKLTKYSAIFEASVKEMHGVTKDVMKRRREELTQLGSQHAYKKENDVNVYERTHKLCFLDILLRGAEEHGLTDEDIREEVDTFMFEGHDTISSALGFALYNLAKHPNVQEKVLAEQVEIFGAEKRTPTYKDLSDMRYLDQVVKETLRMYPSVPFIGRHVNQDILLRKDAFIPKDIDIVIPIFSIHRHENHWKNPDIFDPEHFSPEAVQKRHPFAFLPFSAGPRNCIGQKFAMLEMKSTLSAVVKKFRLQLSPNPDHKLRLKTEMILNPANGIQLLLEQRQ